MPRQDHHEWARIAARAALAGHTPHTSPAARDQARRVRQADSGAHRVRLGWMGGAFYLLCWAERWTEWTIALNEAQPQEGARHRITCVCCERGRPAGGPDLMYCTNYIDH